MVVVRVRVSRLHSPEVVNHGWREGRVQLVEVGLEGRDSLEMVSLAEEAEAVGSVAHVEEHFEEGELGLVLVEGEGEGDLLGQTRVCEHLFEFFFLRNTLTHFN